jgi:hypothetical protein
LCVQCVGLLDQPFCRRIRIADAHYTGLAPPQCRGGLAPGAAPVRTVSERIIGDGGSACTAEVRLKADRQGYQLGNFRGPQSGSVHRPMTGRLDDQVAAPTYSRSGDRAHSARMRCCSWAHSGFVARRYGACQCWLKRPHKRRSKILTCAADVPRGLGPFLESGLASGRRVGWVSSLRSSAVARHGILRNTRISRHNVKSDDRRPTRFGRSLSKICGMCLLYATFRF